MDQNVNRKLTAGTSEEKIEALEFLLQADNIDEYIDAIANLVGDEDKGVRNQASILILASQHPLFPSKIVPFVSSEEITIRNLAGEILIKLGELAVDALIEYNHDRNEDDQKFIIDVLGLIGSERAIPNILSVLSASENDNVILSCIEAIGNIKYAGTIDVLLLLYDRNELYKPSVVEALGKIGSPEALNLLTSKYATEDEITKYSILESLGYIGDVETYFFLLEELMNIKGPLVWPLITSLLLLKEKYNLDLPYDDKIKNLLLYTLVEGSAEHKKVALSLVNVFDDKEILLASLKYLGEDFELDDMIKSKVFRNIEHLYNELPKIVNESPVNLKHILNLFLEAVNFKKNTEEEFNIPLLHSRNIVHAVSNCLNNPDEEIRRVSMEILFNLDIESALLFIDQMITDDNLWNRLRLLELLESVGRPEVFNSVTKLLDDPDEMIREKATEILNQRNLQEIYTDKS